MLLLSIRECPPLLRERSSLPNLSSHPLHVPGTRKEQKPAPTPARCQAKCPSFPSLSKTEIPSTGKGRRTGSSRPCRTRRECREFRRRNRCQSEKVPWRWGGRWERLSSETRRCRSTGRPRCLNCESGKVRGETKCSRSSGRRRKSERSG